MAKLTTLQHCVAAVSFNYSRIVPFIIDRIGLNDVLSSPKNIEGITMMTLALLCHVPFQYQYDQNYGFEDLNKKPLKLPKKTVKTDQKCPKSFRSNSTVKGYP